MNHFFASVPFCMDQISWSNGAIVFPNRIIFGSFIGRKPRLSRSRKPVFRPRMAKISVESGVKYCKDVTLSPFVWPTVLFGIIKLGVNCKALNFKPVDGDLNFLTRKALLLDCNQDGGGAADND